MKLQTILFEALSDMANVHPIYHYTTAKSAYKILESDMLLGSDDGNAWDDEKVNNSKHKKYISFTRDKNFNLSKDTWGIGSGDIDNDLDDNELVIDVIFVINRDKLKTKYKLQPFSFYSMVGHYDYNPEDDEDYDPNEDYGDDSPGYTQKDKELEERVLIDKIAPLKPYVMDIIYNGPDVVLKKKIKEYLGKPTYVGKPRPQFEKYTNWVLPSADDIKNAYVEGGKEYFKNFKEFKEQLRDGRIIKIDKFGDGYIDGRTNHKTQKKLLAAYPDKKDYILSLYENFKNNQKVPLPIVIVFESGDRIIASGNIVMDIAFQMNITPKIILTKSLMEDEDEDDYED